MVTLDQPRLFLDLANPDFNRVVDVLNAPRGASNFPTLRVNRYRTRHGFADSREGCSVSN